MTDPTAEPREGVDPEHNPGGDGVILTSQDVAQGRKSIRMLLVLAVSMTLMAVILAGFLGLRALSPHAPAPTAVAARAG
jgi:hypothetical protein